MKRQDFEERYGKLASNVTYIDLDDPENQIPPEPVTAGMTDTQIIVKPVEWFDAQIASSDKQADDLRGTIRGEESRAGELRTLRRRRITLEAREPEAERITAGWSDKQIMNKDPEFFREQIASSSKLCDGLRNALMNQDKRTNDLRAQRQRRIALGV